MADLENSHATLDHTGLPGVTGGASLTVSENRLTGNVTLTQNTYADGPSLSLLAGTYLLDGHVELAPAAAGWVSAKLMNGSTCEDSSEGFVETGTAGISLPLQAYIVLGSTTTVKIQATSAASGGGTMFTTIATNNTGATNKASYLRAVKIA